jgi:hypothetical protein
MNRACRIKTQTRREAYFYYDPSIVEAELADLAKAGLPEN